MPIVFDIGGVREHLIAAAAVLVGLFGWFLSFIGICVIGTAIADSPNDVKRNRINWVYTFLHLVVLSGIIVTLVTRSVHRSRICVAGFLSFSLMTLFLGMDLAVLEAQFTAILTAGANVRASGIFFLTLSFCGKIGEQLSLYEEGWRYYTRRKWWRVGFLFSKSDAPKKPLLDIPLFTIAWSVFPDLIVLLCYYGIDLSESAEQIDMSGHPGSRTPPGNSNSPPRSNSGFGLPKFSNGERSPGFTLPTMNFSSPKRPSQTEIHPQSNTNQSLLAGAVPTGMAPVMNNNKGGLNTLDTRQTPTMPNTAATAAQLSASMRSPGSTSNIIPLDVGTNQGRKVKALYTYEANTDDPTEVAFTKGEIMTIIEIKGKWWKVSKTLANGTTFEGIAPSNYLELM
ncbi:hypothetical protein BSLG_008229 [Batrachochytrium salamandrivorans]|nr:hypothetical protein BSLG_008229 [Batrachochytrium salamandrivorans]